MSGINLKSSFVTPRRAFRSRLNENAIRVEEIGEIFGLVLHVAYYNA